MFPEMFPDEDEGFHFENSSILILTATNFYSSQISIDIRKTEWNTYKVVLQRPSIYKLDLEPLLESFLQYRKDIKCVKILDWSNFEQTHFESSWDCYDEEMFPHENHQNIVESKYIKGFIIPYEDFISHLGEPPTPKAFRIWNSVSWFEDEIEKERIDAFLTKIKKNTKILNCNDQRINSVQYPFATYDPPPTTVLYFELIVNLPDFKVVYKLRLHMLKLYFLQEIRKRGIKIFSEDFLDKEDKLRKEILPERELLLESLVKEFIQLTKPVSCFFHFMS